MSEEIIEKMNKDLRFLEGFIDDSTTSITVDIQLIKDFRKLLDTVYKQQNEIEYYKDELEKESSIWTKIEKGNDYISKDKIRKIIKELSDQNYNNYELSVALSKSLEALLK